MCSVCLFVVVCSGLKFVANKLHVVFCVVGFEAQNSPKEAILKVLKDARVKYPVMSGASLPLAADGIPHVAVFNTAGKLAWHGHPADEKFKSAVKAALKEVEKK